MRLDLDYLQEQGGGIDTEFLWVRRIGAAMLTLAIIDAACYSLGRKGDYNYRQRNGHSAWLYVMDPQLDWPLSFTNMCLLFDLDPGRVRKRVDHEPMAVLGAARQGHRRDKLKFSNTLKMEGREWREAANA